MRRDAAAAPGPSPDAQQPSLSQPRDMYSEALSPWLRASPLYHDAAKHLPAWRTASHGSYGTSAASFLAAMSNDESQTSDVSDAAPSAPSRVPEHAAFSENRWSVHGGQPLPSRARHIPVTAHDLSGFGISLSPAPSILPSTTQGTPQAEEPAPQGATPDARETASPSKYGALQRRRASQLSHASTPGNATGSSREPSQDEAAPALQYRMPSIHALRIRKAVADSDHAPDTRNMSFAVARGDAAPRTWTPPPPLMRPRMASVDENASLLDISWAERSRHVSQEGHDRAAAPTTATAEALSEAHAAVPPPVSVDALLAQATRSATQDDKTITAPREAAPERPPPTAGAADVPPAATASAASPSTQERPVLVRHGSSVSSLDPIYIVRGSPPAWASTSSQAISSFGSRTPLSPEAMSLLTAGLDAHDGRPHRWSLPGPTSYEALIRDGPVRTTTVVDHAAHTGATLAERRWSSIETWLQHDVSADQTTEAAPTDTEASAAAREAPDALVSSPAASAQDTAATAQSLGTTAASPAAAAAGTASPVPAPAAPAGADAVQADIEGPWSTQLPSPATPAIAEASPPATQPTEPGASVPSEPEPAAGAPHGAADQSLPRSTSQADLAALEKGTATYATSGATWPDTKPMEAAAPPTSAASPPGSAPSTGGPVSPPRAFVPQGPVVRGYHVPADLRLAHMSYAPTPRIVSYGAEVVDDTYESPMDFTYAPAHVYGLYDTRTRDERSVTADDSLVAPQIGPVLAHEAPAINTSASWSRSRESRRPLPTPPRARDTPASLPGHGTDALDSGRSAPPPPILEENLADVSQPGSAEAAAPATVPTASSSYAIAPAAESATSTTLAPALQYTVPLDKWGRTRSSRRKKRADALSAAAPSAAAPSAAAPPAAAPPAASTAPAATAATASVAPPPPAGRASSPPAPRHAAAVSSPASSATPQRPTPSAKPVPKPSVEDVEDEEATRDMSHAAARLAPRRAPVTSPPRASATSPVRPVLPAALPHAADGSRMSVASGPGSLSRREYDIVYPALPSAMQGPVLSREGTKVWVSPPLDGGDASHSHLSMLGAVAENSSFQLGDYFDASLQRLALQRSDRSGDFSVSQPVPPPKRTVLTAPTTDLFRHAPPLNATTVGSPDMPMDEFSYVVNGEGIAQHRERARDAPPVPNGAPPSLPPLDPYLPEEHELMGDAPPPSHAEAIWLYRDAFDTMWNDPMTTNTRLPLDFITKPNSVLARGRPVKKSAQDAQTSVFYASLPEKRHRRRRGPPLPTQTVPPPHAASWEEWESDYDFSHTTAPRTTTPSPTKPAASAPRTAPSAQYLGDYADRMPAAPGAPPPAPGAPPAHPPDTTAPPSARNSDGYEWAPSEHTHTSDASPSKRKHSKDHDSKLSSWLRRHIPGTAKSSQGHGSDAPHGGSDGGHEAAPRDSLQYDAPPAHHDEAHARVSYAPQDGAHAYAADAMQDGAHVYAADATQDGIHAHAADAPQDDAYGHATEAPQADSDAYAAHATYADPSTVPTYTTESYAPGPSQAAPSEATMHPSVSTSTTMKMGRRTAPPNFEPSQPGKYHLAGTVSLPTLHVARTAEQRARNETGMPETEPALIQALLAAPSSSTVRARAGIIRALPFHAETAPPPGQVLVTEERKIIVRPVM